MDMIKIPFADMTTHSHNGVETPVVETGGNIEAEESFLSFVYDREKSGHANSDGPSVKNTPTQAADVPNATDVVQTPAQFLILEVDVQNRLETTVISKALPDQLGHLEPDALISKPAGQLDSNSTPLAEINLLKRVKSQGEVPPDTHIDEREYSNNLAVKVTFETDQSPHEELVLGTLQQPFLNNAASKPTSEMTVPIPALPARADKAESLAGNLQFLTSRRMSEQIQNQQPHSVSEKGGDLARLNTEASYYLFKDSPGQAIQRQEVGKNAVQSNQHNPLPPKITKATLQNENNNITAKMQKSNQETGFAVEKGADKLNPVLPDQKNTSPLELPKSKPRDLYNLDNGVGAQQKIAASTNGLNQETGFAAEKAADKLKPVLPDQKNTSPLELPKSKPQKQQNINNGTVVSQKISTSPYAVSGGMGMGAESSTVTENTSQSAQIKFSESLAATKGTPIIQDAQGQPRAGLITPVRSSMLSATQDKQAQLVKESGFTEKNPLHLLAKSGDNASEQLTAPIPELMSKEVKPVSVPSNNPEKEINKLSSSALPAYQKANTFDVEKPAKNAETPAQQNHNYNANSGESIPIINNSSLYVYPPNQAIPSTKPDNRFISQMHTTNTIRSIDYSANGAQQLPTKPQTYLKTTGLESMLETTTGKPEIIGAVHSEILQTAMPPVDTAHVDQVKTQPETSPLRPEAARYVAQQLAGEARQFSDRPVELTLSPEELGRVRMTFTMSETGINVAVLTERGETLDLLRRHIAMLTEEFREIGYKDVSFDFSSQNQGKTFDGNTNNKDTENMAADIIDNERPEPVILSLEPVTGLDLRL